MTSAILDDGFLSRFLSFTPRPGLNPIPGSVPLTIEAALCPPLVYYIALLFLAPPPPEAIDSGTVKFLRNLLATIAGVLFFRLPLVYHVPQSIGLTYQLGLVGLYGGCRVLDAFFISPYLFGHVPRRVRYEHHPRVETPVSERTPEKKLWSDGGVREPYVVKIMDPTKNVPAERRRRISSSSSGRTHTDNSLDRTLSGTSSSSSSYFSLTRTLSGPDPQPVLETAITEDGWPHTFADRASWALELELSMRGVGFTWTTADVRHTRKTWLPTVGNRIHSILVHVLPVLLVSWAIIRHIYVWYLAAHFEANTSSSFLDSEEKSATSPFDTLVPFPQQLLLTAALGAFLMSAFSLGHSLFAIMLHPLYPSPLSFFPPLYTTRVWSIASVRGFWSYGWHRLFARLFLVYGVWPGEWLERKLTGKDSTQAADMGKVLGGFGSSAFVHAFAVRGVLGGDWASAAGEAKFFALNGVAVVAEGIVIRLVKRARIRRGWPREVGMWYDVWIGRAWWMTVILITGRNFARGWVKAGLVREMAFM